MAAKLPPFVVWRNGRPRWVPGEGARRLGFAGEDMKNPDGRWMNFEQATTWGALRYQAVITARATGQRAVVRPLARGDTVEDLIEDWLHHLRIEQDPAARLSPNTIESYAKASQALLYKPEARADAKARRAKERAAELLGVAPIEREREIFGTTPVAAIDKIALNDFYNYLKRERGHHMARAAVAAFSAAYTWGGLSHRWRLGRNPRHELSLPQPEGRIVIYSDAEIRQLDAAAAD
jgi:hypothetical protein